MAGQEKALLRDTERRVGIAQAKGSVDGRRRNCGKNSKQEQGFLANTQR